MAKTERNESEYKSDQITAGVVFEDFEARQNIVGLFDLLLKIDHRTNPQIYDKVSDKKP